MALINTTTEQEFQDKVIKNSKVVLVDFWAPWCPPCVAMAPALEKIANKMDADLDVVKVNTEASPENAVIATKYGVQSIPNMQVFRDGKVQDELIGLRPQAVLEDELRAHLV